MLQCTEAAQRCSLSRATIQVAVTSHRKDIPVNEEACKILPQSFLWIWTKLLLGDSAPAICHLQYFPRFTVSRNAQWLKNNLYSPLNKRKIHCWDDWTVACCKKYFDLETMIEKSHCVSHLCGEQYCVDFSLLEINIIKLVTTVASKTKDI